MALETIVLIIFGIILVLWCTVKYYKKKEYIILQIVHYRDSSYSINGTPSTKLVYQCLDNGKVAHEIFFSQGFLTKSTCTLWLEKNKGLVIY